MPRSDAATPLCVSTVKRASVPARSSTTPLPLRSSSPIDFSSARALARSGRYRGRFGVNQTLFPGCHRSPDGHRRIEEHRPGEFLAIDGVRQRLPEFALLDEGKSLVVLLGFRLQTEPERIRVSPDAEFNHLQLPVRLGASRGDVVFRTQLALQHVDAARLEPDHSRVLLRDDFEHQAIEVREGRAVVGCPPVPRVAREHNPLAGFVGGQDKRAGANDVRRGGGRLPGRPKRAGRQRGFELVPRQNRKHVEQTEAGPGRRRKGEHDGAIVRRGGRDRLSGNDQSVRQSTFDLLVPCRLQREEHVPRGQRHTIRPGHVGAQVQGVLATVRRRLPFLGQPRLELERGSIDANEPALDEGGDQRAGFVGRDQAVERLGIRPDRRGQLTSSDRTRLTGRCERRRRRAPEEERRGKKNGRHQDAGQSEGSGHRQVGHSGQFIGR